MGCIPWHRKELDMIEWLHFRLKKRNSRNGWKQRGVAGWEGVHTEHMGRTRCCPIPQQAAHTRIGTHKWCAESSKLGPVYRLEFQGGKYVSFHQYKDSLREVLYTPCEETHGGTWHHGAVIRMTGTAHLQDASYPSDFTGTTHLSHRDSTETHPISKGKAGIGQRGC